MGKNIVLCGFMGCGKTTMGKILAKRLGWNFIDLDQFIEQTYGMSVSEIFQKYGEESFRQMERYWVNRLSKRKKIVLSLGGGTVMYFNNGEILKRHNTVVFLDVPFEVCYERVTRREGRPLVQQNTKEQLLKLYEKRYEIYKASATVTVTCKKSPKESAEEILRTLLEKNCLEQGEALDLKVLRRQINQVNRQMVKLFVERMEISRDIGRYKQLHNMDVLDTSREEAVLESVRQMAGEDFADYTEKLFVEIMALSRDYQKKVLEKK